jgi:hypothetical protein
MKIQKYQLIERCTQDDYSAGTPRPILQQVYFDGETLRACDGFKAVVIHPTDIDENDKPGFISLSAALLNDETWDGKWVNPLVEARKVEKGSDTITLSVSEASVHTQAGRFSADPFDSATKYPDFAPNTPKDPGYLFTLDVAHLLDLADTLLDMQGKKGGRRHTGEGLEFYWSQTHPDSVTVKPMVEEGEDSKDYGVLMQLQRGSKLTPMSGVLSPRASGVDTADSDLPSHEEYQRTLARHADVLIERDNARGAAQMLNTELKEAQARIAELEAQHGQWCNPVVTKE